MGDYIKLKTDTNQELLLLLLLLLFLDVDTNQELRLRHTQREWSGCFCLFLLSFFISTQREWSGWFCHKGERDREMGKYIWAINEKVEETLTIFGAF